MATNLLGQFARDVPQFMSFGGGRYERCNVTQTDLAWFWTQVCQAALAQWADWALGQEWSTSLEELSQHPEWLLARLEG